ncbi:MAG: Stp1/IreP family PP2C-type Ser/Thr phosphatase [Thermoanaerobacteraceae bacterium]|uniref:Stp1/IreP family PP2C-type Ser/Thr phosphatase n=1 Tax=Thermanaeromonas sp. C210 TaxID=2731925 RepID=UPI00155D152B|nr:Stp1/IreP family PP2C-type Ser/Thr phosphatase [Thermanaeromonas sp. C210]MBE3580759.1 Stp1/IreP family PP2C-type Ser/Thr phosphatase [Thermoanaerobacteraceae bacterium]GFN24012.1 protein-serine/threonine phosphatase [Thermanaeromonas sp. C210]
MRAEVLTHPGLMRSDNEDAYLVDLGLGLLAVADGMGGHQAGEVASALALRALGEKIKEHYRGDPLVHLVSAVRFANRVVYSSALSRREYRGMGTTLTVAWVIDDKVLLAHVGDSRAYLFRDGQLQVLTHDHSYVGELVRSGGLTQEEARLHPHRNILTRALGTEDEVEVDGKVVSLMEGDLLLLCTDGLPEVVRDEEIAFTVGQGGTLREILENLLALALNRGGPDNITVVLAAYD